MAFLGFFIALATQIAAIEYDRAISDYDKAIEINPGYADAYYNKAVACEKAGRLKEAIEAYRVFIQNAPPQYASYIERAKERIRELGGSID